MLGSSATWTQTMNNVAADQPDFLLDLGDTFAMDSVTTAAGANSAYLTQRQYFDLVGNSASIFWRPAITSSRKVGIWMTPAILPPASRLLARTPRRSTT